MNRDKSLVHNQRVRLPTLQITRAPNVPRQSCLIRCPTRNFPAEIKRAVGKKLRLITVDDLRARLRELVHVRHPLESDYFSVWFLYSALRKHAWMYIALNFVCAATNCDLFNCGNKPTSVIPMAV